ncbi:MAG TPA: ClpXP protease specificity-enhancing factor SspB [Azospirillaceae bacterium]|nr:ClpXP protease specificity-enhancing factor SspB [Azospirillaceae bacterium]
MKEYLRYDKMVEAALRGVVRDALEQVEKKGLPGNHHFYLTFRTHYPGVKIPEQLTTQYPSEMTIVLQYQFYGLEVHRDYFHVTLSFNNVHEQLRIPFAAISTFADPSVNFALQFQPLSAQEASDTMEKIEASVTEKAAAIAVEPEAPKPPEKRGEVVALDAFRKK